MKTLKIISKNFKSFWANVIGLTAEKNMQNELTPILNSTIGGRVDSFILNLNESKGLYVWTHEATSPPRFQYCNDHNGNRPHVTRESLNQIKIQKIVVKKLPFPYNPCYRDVNTFPLNKTIIDYFKSTIDIAYKQVFSFELCYDVYTI